MNYSFNRVMLLISSYIPLLIIIWMQRIDKLLKIINGKIGNRSFAEMIKNKSYIIKGLELKETLILIFLTILIIYAIVYLIFMIKMTKKNHIPESYEVIKVKNKSVEQMWSYISIYIFPFITLDLAGWVGMGTFIILTTIIGYVYLKNNIIYINPMLIGYNIYLATLQEPGNSKITQEVMLLSKKSEVEVQALKDIPVSIYRIGKGIYIDYNKRKK